MCIISGRVEVNRSRPDWPHQRVISKCCHMCACPCVGQHLGQPRRLSSPFCLHVSPCPSKTAAWQITCVGGPPCSCPAVRPPLINAQAGARAVWQHKTNNATTQPSLLLTEMQPTALFRPLRLHSAPCSRPSKSPLHPLHLHLHLPALLHQTFMVAFFFFFAVAGGWAQTVKPTQADTVYGAAFVTTLIVFC